MPEIEGIRVQTVSTADELKHQHCRKKRYSYPYDIGDVSCGTTSPPCIRRR